MPQLENKIFWHTLSERDVLQKVNSAENGLSTKEAQIRLGQFGANTIESGAKINPFQIFLRQFRSFLVALLLIAALISGFLREWVDAAAIMIIVLMNAFIGFFQEYRAEKSLDALKKMTAPEARVLRDNAICSIKSIEVVPGDLLLLDAGDIVAGDARVLNSSSLKTMEAMLTGEVIPVEKKNIIISEINLPPGDQINMVFSGTGVTSGHGIAVVVSTGSDSRIGQIAHLMSQTPSTKSSLMQKLNVVGRILTLTALSVSGMLFFGGFLRGISPLELFLASVSLAVAAVPEGLPSVVTIALALGVAKMSKRHVLVRKLPSMETLGSVTVICTDKTGTLTHGEMTARFLFTDGKEYRVTGEGYNPQGSIVEESGAKLTVKGEEEKKETLNNFLTAGLLGINARLNFLDNQWNLSGDPTEGAILLAAMRYGIKLESVLSKFPKIREFPFDSDRKRQSVLCQNNHSSMLCINGAPESIVDLCVHLELSSGQEPFTQKAKREILEICHRYADQGLRVVATARRNIDEAGASGMNCGTLEKQLTFLGLTAMYDPPRKEAYDAVAKCQKAGIKVLMITGDHPETARAIGHDLGIFSDNHGILTGKELHTLSEEQLAGMIDSVRIFARVLPVDKLTIVRALKKKGHIVAMTGDGVNDAPALKGADIGVAMGKSGTSVAREAADFIITNDNFSSIVAAVEEGRVILNNIRKALYYLLSGNIGEILFMAIGVMLGYPIFFLPVHLLWINLITDGLPALALAQDAAEDDVMNKTPLPPEQGLMTGKFYANIFFAGILTAATTFYAFWIGYQDGNMEKGRTFAFFAIMTSELVRALGARSEDKPVWLFNPFKNTYLILTSFGSLAAQHLFCLLEPVRIFLKLSPLTLQENILLTILGLIPFAIIEIRKAVKLRFRFSRLPFFGV
ncbi:MAG: cation-translocating P-type ATPase [Spirochaetia bacterium]|nr:cation-translocating P-type ATPase [Spirochaetia bacterium]